MSEKIIMSLIVNSAVFSVLFFVLLAARKALGKRISPAIMLLLWLVLAIKLVVPFGFESRISILPAQQAAVFEPIQAPQEGFNISEITAQSIEPGKSEESIADSPAEAYSAPQPEPLPWETIAISIWASGAAAAGFMLCLSAANIRRRAMHACMNTPLHVTETLEECRKALGIRRRVGAVVQSAIDKPVVTGAMKPLLILPEDAAWYDTQKLNHVLTHELTHVKRGDLCAIRAMNVLSALYWFNPLVWLCFRLVREDMETACDQRVIEALGKHQRLPYIETVLSFAGGSKDSTVAAMGFSRPALEKRVKGMYGITKTGIKGRMAAALTVLLMITGCALTACKPVVPEPVKYTPITAAQYQAAEHWSETVNEGKLTIEIDTDIMRPETAEFPVVKLETLIFTQQKVDELVGYFADGRKLYKPHGRTKADYAKEIEGWLTPRWSNGRLVVTAEEEFQAHELERLMADSPESYPKEYTGSTLTYDLDYETLAEKKESGKNYLNVMVDSGGSDPRIMVNNYVEGYNPCASFLYSAPQSELYWTEKYYDQLVQWIEDEKIAVVADDQRKNSHIEEWPALFERVKITEEEARAQAEKAIGDLGIEDMMLLSASKAASREHPENGGWRLEYVRQNGNVPVYRNLTGAADQDGEPPRYLVSFSEEELYILVTESGIEDFYWHGCANALETVSQRVELMPLDEIKRILKERIIEMKTFDNFESEQKTVKVKSTRLCMGYINTDDGNALIIPVWVFEVEESYYINKLEPRIYENEYILSAIDGGIIQRLPRYLP